MEGIYNNQLLELLLLFQLIDFNTNESNLTAFSSWASITSLIVAIINSCLILNFTYRVKKKKKIKYLLDRLKKIYDLLVRSNNRNNPIPSDIMDRIKNIFEQLRSQTFILYSSQTDKEMKKISLLKYESTTDLDKVIISLHIILTNFEEVV